MRKLKLLLVLLLLLAPLFSVYSQDEKAETPMISSVLIQLHQISIQQAKQSPNPQTALEAEYNQIINELELTYQAKLKEAETNFQAQLTEQKTSSEQQVQKVQDKADQELALIKVKLGMIETQNKKDTWQTIGNSAAWFAAGFSTRSVLSDFAVLP